MFWLTERRYPGRNGLDSGQAVIVAAVSVADPVAAFVAKVVDVYAAEMRAHGTEEFTASPADVGWRVS